MRKRLIPPPLCVSLREYTTQNIECKEKNNKFGKRYFYYNGTKILLINNSNMLKEDIDKKEKFILKFNEFVDNESEDIWITPNKISEILETDEIEVVKFVESFDEFIKNSKGQYTTKKEYFKHTPFIKRFKDLLNGTIE